MELKQTFEQAVAQSKQLSRKPDTPTLLRLYSLYKQATEGDAPAESGAGAFDFVAKAKHEAWAGLRGKNRDSAMNDYIALIDELMQKG